MKLSEKQVKVAAKWWADVLANPKFDTLGSTRGNPEADPGGAGALAEIMATAYAPRQLPDVLERFRIVLSRLLSEKEFYSEDTATLDVDYGPCEMLANAAEQAGLSGGSITTFPWKTHMNFYGGGVQVYYGYGASRVDLLAESHRPQPSGKEQVCES